MVQQQEPVKARDIRADLRHQAQTDGKSQKRRQSDFADADAIDEASHERCCKGVAQMQAQRPARQLRARPAESRAKGTQENAHRIEGRACQPYSDTQGGRQQSSPAIAKLMQIFMHSG
jgi:hypothetical protein